MDVSSVISSYSLQGEVSLGGKYAPIGRGNTFGSVGATGRYTGNPTISYQPLSGDKFAKSLMTPIPVTGFLFLIQSGYPADLVLRVCVNSINGLENAYGGASNLRAGSPAFRRAHDGHAGIAGLGRHRIPGQAEQGRTRRRDVLAPLGREDQRTEQQDT